MKCAAPRCEREVEIAEGAIGNAARKRFCSSRCRKSAHDEEIRGGRVARAHRRPPEVREGVRVRPADIDRPASFRYDDPPYPGRAHLYPEREEVDHALLVEELCDEHPDGWALSTSASAVGDVLALCPRGVRVGAWRRQWRPHLERAWSWEPVIFCGGRRQPRLRIPDSIEAAAPVDWDLPGRKPHTFFLWVYLMLGADRGDSMVEGFPGSGGGALAWERYPGALIGANDLRLAVVRGRRPDPAPVVDVLYTCPGCGTGWVHRLRLPARVPPPSHCGAPMVLTIGEVRGLRNPVPQILPVDAQSVVVESETSGESA